MTTENNNDSIKLPDSKRFDLLVSVVDFDPRSPAFEFVHERKGVAGEEYLGVHGLEAGKCLGKVHGRLLLG